MLNWLFYEMLTITILTVITIKFNPAGMCRHLDKALVFGAWLISIVASSFYIPYSRGINANPDSTDMFEQKGGCYFNLPGDWWKVTTDFIILVRV